MKEKILNLTTIVFLGIFGFIIFTTINSANSHNQRPQPQSNLKFDKEFSGKISVIDGDSIRVGEKEVRLFGIDAPEYSQTCFNAKKQEYNCGHISREFLFKLANKKEANCFYAEKDKYDRYLSKCSIDKLSINEEIIKNGMAVIYNFTEADEKMKNLEAEAKTKKLGIWQGAFQLPREYRKENPRKN